ncbi:GntR family transcriptional regulator [Saccharopolyspora oryzae]|uniref:GntR family transcriptional regulator n=1 Tax=Saccharopolyspora oryzae TaxID=2997343 RepID=A0ABT4USQ5_9PSEU|nr:GntR family transcriptional regulator [Saccharopolyspora oryzae]MDA3624573.1 GntR family transcriptional regulator [Saccharopolyspora oryzae]
MTTPSNKLYRHQKPLRDIVGERIRSGIYDGTLPPGTRLVERDLAELYEVSRLPVREALRILQNEGLVEHLPTRGLVVRTLDRSQVCELYDIREALEVLAARQAAERVAGGAENHFAETMREMREAVDAGDVESAHAANSRLHDEITALSGNTLLAEILEPLVGRVGWLRRKIEDFNLIQAEHVALCEAIASGDPDRAAAAASDHVRASRARTLEFLFGA